MKTAVFYTFRTIFFRCSNTLLHAISSFDKGNFSDLLEQLLELGATPSSNFKPSIHTLQAACPIRMSGFSISYHITLVFTIFKEITILCFSSHSSPKVRILSKYGIFYYISPLICSKFCHQNTPFFARVRTFVRTGSPLI